MLTGIKGSRCKYFAHIQAIYHMKWNKFVHGEKNLFRALLLPFPKEMKEYNVANLVMHIANCVLDTKSSLIASFHSITSASHATK